MPNIWAGYRTLPSFFFFATGATNYVWASVWVWDVGGECVRERVRAWVWMRLCVDFNLGLGLEADIEAHGPPKGGSMASLTTLH